MSYKLTKGSKGDHWLKDGKFVSDADVPNGEKKKLRQECIFCDAPTEHKRLVLGMMVDLCDHHYYSQTLGATVAQARKEGLLNGSNETTPVGSAAQRPVSPQGYHQG